MRDEVSEGGRDLTSKFNSHIVMTTASNLLSLLQGDSFLDILNALVQLEPPKTSTFARIVDEVMGL